MNDFQVKNPLAKAVDIMHSGKDIKKNRGALIRHFYSLPEPNRFSITHYFYELDGFCLCAKGQLMQKFFDEAATDKFNDLNLAYITPDEIQEILEFSNQHWEELENRYEGRTTFKKHNFAQIADWLQTLPGWPRVL